MNTYAYRIYKPGNLNNPQIGGTVHAETMEQASRKIIDQNNVDVIHEVGPSYTDHYFMRNGKKVGIIIYINPEEF